MKLNDIKKLDSKQITEAQLLAIETSKYVCAVKNCGFSSDNKTDKIKFLVTLKKEKTKARHTIIVYL